MNINIIEESIAGLAPLGARGPLGALRLGGMTWRALLEERWTRSLRRADDLTLSTSLAFWPSEELLEELSGLSGDFAVVSEDGVRLAMAFRAPQKNALGIPLEEIHPSRRKQGGSVTEVSPGASLVVRYPWDLLAVQEDVLQNAPHGSINGVINEGSVIDGNLDLGDSSMILPGVYITGNVVIGQNCLIGPNCTIRGNTSIGDGCRIGQGAEIKNSILMDNVKVPHVAFVGDSILADGVDLGAGTMIANWRHDGATIASLVGRKMVDTGRDHFGAVFAEDVRTGINTSIWPGVKISAGVVTMPGEVVQKDR
ncbi:MAG: hypothetical protein J6Y80_01210 [Victivallales bacterium]|nr:hypothetical protein [Victivallales bacterium]